MELTTAIERPSKHMPEHWYRICETECVLCGRGGKWRERVYGPRPRDDAGRYRLEQYVCGDHYDYYFEGD